MEAQDPMRGHQAVVKRESGLMKVPCKARSRRGVQCRQPAIPGGTVCRFHGGAAPQVKRKAEERLAAMVNPALKRMSEIIRLGDDSVAAKVCKDVLDANGIGAKHHRDLGLLSGESTTSGRNTVIQQTTVVRVSEYSDEELDLLERLLLKGGVIKPQLPGKPSDIIDV